jgi:hypothetical protein
MLIHNGWNITHSNNPNDAGSGYWLKPPQHRDPHQTLIPMPSKNPLIAALEHGQSAA